MNDRISYWIADGGILGRLRLAASEAGLCKLALGRESNADFFSWLARVIQPAAPTEQCTPVIGQALTEINAYLSGSLRAFSTPLDLRGTPFQQRVWAEVGRLPYGATSTYQQIATCMGRPKAVRAVGAANAANPLPLFIPCHRVIGADGALRGYGGGLVLKAALLQLEKTALTR
jgi:O-6-methylguanine DNA methyltransferase